jgi:hypothetical protein
VLTSRATPLFFPLRDHHSVTKGAINAQSTTRAEARAHTSPGNITALAALDAVARSERDRLASASELCSRDGVRSEERSGVG